MAEAIYQAMELLRPFLIRRPIGHPNIGSRSHRENEIFALLAVSIRNSKQ